MTEVRSDERERGARLVALGLPVQLTSFVGRVEELDSLARLLSERRLVTITGPGGSGKTRLAGETARWLLEKHPDGVWWVELAPLADASLVPAALASALGIPDPQVGSLDDAVTAYLQERRCLVVLDNCEHLVAACAALASRLLEGCPAATVLATSREPLGVAGETTYRLPPLSVPAGPSVSAVMDSEAGRLFVDRARACVWSFTLTDEHAAAVAEICIGLDGLPLAIELAGARTRLLTPQQIADGLTDRFRLLTGGVRWALPRHRTLEASVAWSHDLLDSGQRVVFRRLAVFAGSFTIDAAEAVCGGEEIESDEVLELLGNLVDQSLVQVVVDGERARYRLLDTIRDYANRKLVEAAERDDTRHRHLDFVISFAEQAAAGLEGADLVPWLARVDEEIDNLRAALTWSIEAADAERGVRLVALLTLYWFARSDLTIGRARLEATLEHANPGTRELAEAHGALSIINYRAGDMDSAERHGDAAVDVARRFGDPRALSRALHWRAWARCWGRSDRLSAWADFEEARAVLAGGDDHVVEAMNLALFAWSYADTTEAPRAVPLLDEALAITAAGRAPHAHCYSMLVRGLVDLKQGQLEAASTRLGSALAMAKTIGDYYAEVFARGFLAYTELFRGHYDEARALCEDGLTTALEHRSPMTEGLMRSALGALAFAEGAVEAASEEVDASSASFAPLWKGAAAVARSEQAQVALGRQRFDDARRGAAEALELARETDMVLATVGGLGVQASLALLDGNPHRAEDLIHDTLDIAVETGSQLAACDAIEALARAVAEQGRAEEAARLVGVAQGLRNATGYARFPIQEPMHSTLCASLVDTIGDDGFTRASDEGEAMSLDDAVAYARRRRGARKRPGHGWQSLTPTELKVVELVAEGLTNPQIGERLFISRRTVQSHLAHVFTKVGLSTRAEAAAQVARRNADTQGEPSATP